MHILILFHLNHHWFILTILPTIIQKNTKLHALPLTHSSIWLGLHMLSKIKGTAMTSAVKCTYTGPIEELTNTNTCQNTKHKKGFNINILHA